MANFKFSRKDQGAEKGTSLNIVERRGLSERTFSETNE